MHREPQMRPYAADEGNLRRPRLLNMRPKCANSTPCPQEMSIGLGRDPNFLQMPRSSHRLHCVNESYEVLGAFISGPRRASKLGASVPSTTGTDTALSVQRRHLWVSQRGLSRSCPRT